MVGSVVLAAIGPLGHDPDELRRRAQELMSRPPYVEEQGVIARALEWLGDRVAALLQGGLGQLMGSPIVPWVIAVVGAIGLGVVVWRLTRGLVADRSVAEVPAEVTTRSAADWHADADAHAARGELRDALRCRYAALVVTLVARGAIDDVPGRTVRELDVEVARTLTPLAADVAEAGECFEWAVYGGRAVSEADLDTVTRVARRAERGATPEVAVGVRP